MSSASQALVHRLTRYRNTKPYTRRKDRHLHQDESTRSPVKKALDEHRNQQQEEEEVSDIEADPEQQNAMQYGLDRAGKGSETLRPNVPRNFGPGYGIMTQSRTFIHYVEVLRDNGLPSIKCTHVGDVGNPFNAYEYESAMGYIPYSNICASMNLNRFQTFMIQALRFRPLEFGYMISDVVPLSDELTNLGGAVVQNTTFNERPL